MNWRKVFASANVGFWLFLALAFVGSMIWAKSRDPFERIWFNVKTAHYGKVKGVAVLPVGVKEAELRSQNLATGLPVVFYVYGSGGSLINSGNELRQLAELGMAAVAIEYNQTNEAKFGEQFTALREYVAKQAWAKNEPTTWVGFSLGAQRTLSYLLRTVGASPTVAGEQHALPLPNVYVRLAGGVVPELEEFKTQNLKFKTHVLLVHGENDEIFPVAEAKQVAAFFQTNGVATELKVFPGKGHSFDSDRAVVIRTVGEQIKAQLTPEHPLPEFPVTKDYPYLLCILPAFLWVGFWIYLRMGRTGDSHAAAGNPPDTGLTAVTDAPLHVRSKFKRWEIALRVTAFVLATLALAQTGIHLITPRLAISDSTIRIARKWLLAPKWKEDFETLAAKPFWRAQRLETLLTHVELSNYCVYELINWKVDKAIYREFVLSPIIDSESDSELNWRRPLWEFFYPRIRKEDSPEAAAEIVVRNLRERVTIVPAERISAARSGIETIWRDQITDERGFQRIYVATLRSVGVGARINSVGNAEFWDSSQWRLAPPANNTQ